MKSLLVDKPDNKHNNHSLLSWLSHIKHHHDNHPVVSFSTSTKKQQPTNTTALLSPIDKERRHSSDGSMDTSSLHSKVGTPSSIFRHYLHKDNLFHRPHGLMHAESRQSSTTTTINDADDELETTTDENDDRSRDGTTRPYLYENESSTSRHSSVSSLPEDIDSPRVGFKKLKRDGILIDWDESDMIQEEEEEDFDSDFQRVDNRTYLRSVIRNDLLRLALNG